MKRYNSERVGNKADVIIRLSGAAAAPGNPYGKDAMLQ